MSAAVTENVAELEKHYLLQNYARHPIVLHRGDGPYMWDTMASVTSTSLPASASMRWGRTTPHR